MVNKNKKSKSKRVTLTRKHKILKKVKEHHKKKAKDAKKHHPATNNRKTTSNVDPNDCPLTDQELNNLKAQRSRAIQDKELAQKRKHGLLKNDDMDKDNPSTEEPPAPAKSHDHSERSFYKELVKVIEASDVILQVLDARDPLGTRCVDMEKLVMKTDPNKRVVLVLNKIDLVPREAVEKWLKYLRGELPAVAFKCNTQEQRSNLGSKSTPKAAKSSNVVQRSDTLGADTLIKLLKNYTRSCDAEV